MAGMREDDHLNGWEATLRFTLIPLGADFGLITVGSFQRLGLFGFRFLKPGGQHSLPPALIDVWTRISS
jgi:hypothetical protein